MMKRSGMQWALSGVLLALSIALVIVGLIGYRARNTQETLENLDKMRNHTVLRTAAGTIVDEVARLAKKEARAYAKKNIRGRDRQAAYANQKERQARQEADAKYRVFDVDKDAFSAAVLKMEASLDAYDLLLEEERETYRQQWLAAHQNGEEEAADTDADATAQISEDSVLLLDATPKVDYSDFVKSEELCELERQIDPRFDTVFELLQGTIPDLPDEMKGEVKERIALVIRGDNSFRAAYDRYQEQRALSALSSDQQRSMRIARAADNMVLYGIAALVLSLTVFFIKTLKKKLGLPRLIISLFFILLLIISGLYSISIAGMMGTVLWRTGMYGVLALAMLPGIQSGISLNMGMTVGIISGLLSTLMALQWNMRGWSAFFFSVVVGIVLAVPVGILYGRLLNRLKGSEMTVSTYVGFSYVSLFCIAWMLLPFNNPKLTWALGSGLRLMHNMRDSFGKILDSLWSFQVLGVHVPTGLLLFFLLCCGLMWLFSRSKSGTAMIAAGANPRFAEAAGVNVNRMRVVGTTISTVIAAVGIIVYSQSFGFMQLYNGPKQMGFVAASAILIGGATVKKAKVSHVIIGTFLFQGVLALGIQVANAAISEGGLSEVMRILISNGIILYALTQTGGEGRG